MAISPSAENGLKTQSVVRFDKIATLENRIIVGKLGDVGATFLATASNVFFGVFGFVKPE